MKAKAKVLDVLASCGGTGATHDALIYAARCDPAEIERLLAEGRISKLTAPMANPPGLVITRYWINNRKENAK